MKATENDQRYAKCTPTRVPNRPASAGLLRVLVLGLKYLRGWKFHALSHDLKGHWSVWVKGSRRPTFTFEGTDAVPVDYQAYH
ncbi:MAG: type II toxin-antitoxin system RelE/ParE family toxin [Burkholderiales bacterium]|nr:type II toxin-antitoxin system RelE/ParE family toxin [Burkholderiales bacterium]